jgi:hypothetical protein
MTAPVMKRAPMQNCCLAAGWRAYLDDDGNVVVFCPECAEREFGVHSD